MEFIEDYINDTYDIEELKQLNKMITERINKINQNKKNTFKVNDLITYGGNVCKIIKILSKNIDIEFNQGNDSYVTCRVSPNMIKNIE